MPKDFSRDCSQPENREPDKKGETWFFWRVFTNWKQQVAENKNRARFDRRRPATHQLQVMTFNFIISARKGMRWKMSPSINLIQEVPIRPLKVIYFYVSKLLLLFYFQVCDGIVRSKLPLFDQVFAVLSSFAYQYCNFCHFDTKC